VSIIRQEYSEGRDNMDLRYPPLSPTATPMIVHQNSVCVSSSLGPLDVRLPLVVHQNSVCVSLGPLDVRLPLILRNPNPEIAESLLTVSMSTVIYYLDLAQDPRNSHCAATETNDF
jgi:hypothetical protein